VIGSPRHGLVHYCTNRPGAAPRTHRREQCHPRKLVTALNPWIGYDKTVKIGDAVPVPTSKLPAAAALPGVGPRRGGGRWCRRQ
jgi:fumarate hydratase class II